MFLTNQHLDKLTAAQVNFADHGVLQNTCLSAVWELIYMNIETNRADPNLPHFSATQDPLNKDHSDHGDNGDSDSNINEPDNNEDGGDVEGPTVEAHVDIAKIAHKYFVTQSCQNILTYVNSVPYLS
jgi:hypothetical protein